MEHLYIVTKNENGGVDAIGVAEREAAHRLGIRHATTICALIVADGPEAGKMVVHDRYLKLLGKAEGRAGRDPAAARKAEQLRAHPLSSLNLFGGHFSAPDTQAVGDVCHTVGEAEMCACMLQELGEELALLPKAGEAGERTIRKRLADGSLEPLRVVPCPVDAAELTCLGYAEYTAPFNEEISTLFAMPISADAASRLVAAYNYCDASGGLVDIALPLHTLSLTEAQAMYGAGPKPDRELCDAFTRLLLDVNRDTWARLTAYVEPYRLIGEMARAEGPQQLQAARAALEAQLTQAKATLAQKRAAQQQADSEYADAHHEAEVRAQKEAESPFSYAMPSGFAEREWATLRAARHAAEAVERAARLAQRLEAALG